MRMRMLAILFVLGLASTGCGRYVEATPVVYTRPVDYPSAVRVYTRPVYVRPVYTRPVIVVRRRY